MSLRFLPEPPSPRYITSVSFHALIGHWRSGHSRECLGHHMKGTPGIGEMLVMCAMSGNSIIKCLLSA